MIIQEALASSRLDGETQVDEASQIRLEEKATLLLHVYGEDADWLSIAAMFAIGCERLQEELDVRRGKDRLD